MLATTESRADGSSFDFSIVFSFQAHDGGTLMTLTQSGFPTAELRDEHGRGVANASPGSNGHPDVTWFPRANRLLRCAV